MKKQNDKEIILTIVVGLLVIYYFTQSNAILLVCIAIGVLGIFSDVFAEKLSWAWTKVGHIIGNIISPIILATVFFGFLTPLAFLQKLFSKNDNLKFKNPEKTVFDTRDHQYTSEDLENLW